MDTLPSEEEQMIKNVAIGKKLASRIIAVEGILIYGWILTMPRL